MEPSLSYVVIPAQAGVIQFRTRALAPFLVVPAKAGT
jgi:hypothetical protein